jgi:hypothetical protein
MTDHETPDQAAATGSELEERPRPATRRRLKVALSCSAVAGLVLVGDFVRQSEARAESAAAVKKGRHQKPPRQRNWSLMIPWIISLLSVVALIIVIVATT